MRTTEMSFVCKKCKKAFRKDLGVYEDSDEYCPHCDNHYVSMVRKVSLRVSVEKGARRGVIGRKRGEGGEDKMLGGSSA